MCAATRQVRRSFKWLAPTGSFDDPSLDTRPVNTLVCFYPFDNYVVGIFRCVRIMLPTCANFQSFPVRTVRHPARHPRPQPPSEHPRASSRHMLTECIRRFLKSRLK